VLSFREKREFNLSGLLFESFKLIDLKMMCCTSIIIKPNPNSTAERIKKKKVNDKMLRLSYTSPIDKQITYNVIHKSSAVNNKCSAVFIFNAMLVNIIKNRRNRKLISPKTIS